MINNNWGISKIPFKRDQLPLIKQQKEIFDMIKIHAQQGGFSVIVGEPGVGKTVLREHIENLNESREHTVISCSQTMHTYKQIIWQLARSFKLKTSDKNIEIDLIQEAFAQIRERKIFYVLIDEAHLLEFDVLRKLRLLFEKFPKNHNLILFGQPELMHSLSLNSNRDIKSRITYSAVIRPLCDDDIENFILTELESVRMGKNTFDEGALQLIVRSVEGNLRLCRNLCLASLVQAACETKKIATISHVNQVLVQPHWRSHEELIKQQA